MNIAHRLTQSVVFAPPTGLGANGNPTYGAQQTIAARVEYGTHFRYGRDGEQTICNEKVVTLVQIPVGSRVWIPGDNPADTTAARRPQDIVSATSFDGSCTIFETYL